MSVPHCHILEGLDGDFVKKMMGLSTTEKHPKGACLFHQKDPANHFYILVNGRVALGVGEPMHTTYIAHIEGEAIGWSSLTGCSHYTASAICVDETRVLKFKCAALKTLLDSDSATEYKFYRNLSQTLENRLMQSFELLCSLASASGTTSLEEGQIYDPFELI